MKFWHYLFVFLLSTRILTSSIKENEQYLIEHVKQSISNASSHKSKIVSSILDIEGMSSAKVRHLLNNLCSLPGASYLEIGVYQGSTFISALYGNSDTLVSGIAIDNWSEFGHQKNTFISNTSLYLPKNSFRFYENDAFSTNIQSVFQEPINIYFYDGNHSVTSQKKAFTYFNSIFSTTFIAIVDDWNWDQVQKGTKQAFEELSYTILFEKVLPAYKASDKENWWNGIYIAVIRK